MDLYKLTCTFNFTTPAFSPLTRGLELVACGFKLVTHEFELVTRGFDLATCGLELITRRSEFSRMSKLVTRVLLYLTGFYIVGTLVVKGLIGCANNNYKQPTFQFLQIHLARNCFLSTSLLTLFLWQKVLLLLFVAFWSCIPIFFYRKMCVKTVISGVMFFMSGSPSILAIIVPKLILIGLFEVEI